MLEGDSLTHRGPRELISPPRRWLPRFTPGSISRTSAGVRFLTARSATCPIHPAATPTSCSMSFRFPRCIACSTRRRNLPPARVCRRMLSSVSPGRPASEATPVWRNTWPRRTSTPHWMDCGGAAAWPRRSYLLCGNPRRIFTPPSAFGATMATILPGPYTNRWGGVETSRPIGAMRQ